MRKIYLIILLLSLSSVTGQETKISIVNKDVTIGEYFNYIDSLVIKYDSIVPYNLTEHLIVRNNPWIVDTLANTDYYKMMEKDSFVYDQKKLFALRQGDTIKIPDSTGAGKLKDKFKRFRIDINIPEYKLRIYLDSLKLFELPIRVGQNRKRYLKMSDQIVDLKTIHGTGIIIRHNRNPDFYNPVDGKRFYETKRDDQKVTLMPQIPWIETRINGLQNGQMIHPTTNPETLGKAYSNGCIGTKEGDGWIIYYYAPINTQINIRYDLKTLDENGNEIELEDIYGYKSK